MNRTTARTILRKRLQEYPIADQWTNAELNTYLNLGYQRMLTRILPTDPHALIYVVTTNIVANQADYAWPTGFLYETFMEIKPSGATAYREMQLEPTQDAKRANAERLGTGETDTDDLDVFYTSEGEYFTLDPVPTANATAGIRIHYVPTPSIDSDSDIWQIKYPLHIGIVYEAELLAIAETQEDGTQTRQALEELVGTIPLYYKRSGGRLQGLRPTGH